MTILNPKMTNPLNKVQMRPPHATELAAMFMIVSVLVIAYGIPQKSSGVGASLYLSPSSGSFLVGSTFTISIFLNTGGANVNTVWANLKFPPKILQVTTPAAGTSFFSEWLSPPNYSNEKGIISFQGGISGGIATSAGLISSITFRAIASGTAKIEFTEGSRVLSHDAKGTDILTNTLGGEYKILVPQPEGPNVFSPTHPDAAVWYSDSSPAFAWDKEEGVDYFSWSLSQNPHESPGGIYEGDQTFTSFEDIPDGVWYFHIKQKKQGAWGKTSHVAIKIDVTPPREFMPRIETYSRLLGSQAMVYFETTDDFSGVEYYEVSVISLSETGLSRSFFTEELSPYKVPYKEAGKYNVIIRAVDGAGNIRENEVIFRLVTPIITHIQGEGLEIRGVFIPWWAAGLAGIFVGAVIFIMFWMLTARLRRGRVVPNVFTMPAISITPPPISESAPPAASKSAPKTVSKVVIHKENEETQSQV